MKLTIREATAADAASVIRLIGQMATMAGEPSSIDQEMVERYLRTPGSTILLAESNGQAVGLLSYSIRPGLFHAGDSLYVEEVVVDEGARRQGVAGELLDTVIARGEVAGCAEISLSVMTDNTEAVRLYKKHGLVEQALFLEKHYAKPPS